MRTRGQSRSAALWKRMPPGARKGSICRSTMPRFTSPNFGEKMPQAKPSMYLDHIARRVSEIDAINGMVPTVAAQVGTSAPYNEAVSAIVRSREVDF